MPQHRHPARSPNRTPALRALTHPLRAQDQDFALGGWTPMKQTTERWSKKGATAANWFIHTPVRRARTIAVPVPALRASARRFC